MLGLERDDPQFPQHFLWMGKIINTRLLSLGVDTLSAKDEERGLQLQREAMAEGTIWKKSQFRGIW